MGCGMGGACRTAYGHEYARLIVLLQAMQGLGKPGVNLWGNATGAPANYSVFFPGYADLDAMMSFSRAAKKKAINPVEQRLYRLLLADSILDPPVKWMGEGFCGQKLEQQFAEFVYPMPGYPEIRMLYRYGAASLGTMTEGNKLVKMFQSPKLETVVVQDCWWHTETRFADMILPACTNFERNDIAEWGEAGGYLKWCTTGSNYRVITYQQKCIEPLGESKSDYWIFSQLAKRLGVWEDFSDGGKIGRGLDQGLLRRERPAQVHLLGGVREEGLLRNPGAGAVRVHARLPLVLRRQGLRHAGRDEPEQRHREGQPVGHPQREDRVRVRQSDQVHPGRRRKATRAPLHPQLGRPRVRAGREVSACR